jgi:iron-sulfur cluster repair protein YtfE (RIC family)
MTEAQILKNGAKKGKGKVDENVIYLKNVSEIITRIIDSYEKREKVVLTSLISEVTKKNRVSKAPKLV